MFVIENLDAFICIARVQISSAKLNFNASLLSNEKSLIEFQHKTLRDFLYEVYNTCHVFTI